jgi:hypothetical protein
MKSLGLKAPVIRKRRNALLRIAYSAADDFEMLMLKSRLPVEMYALT